MERKERMMFSKKKIKINPSDTKAHNKLTLQTRMRTEPAKQLSQKDEFDKLLDITTRCIDYYNKFVEEKETEVEVVAGTFAEIHSNLTEAFNGIVEEVKLKYRQICQFLLSKEQQLKQIKSNQQNALKETLEEIKSVHLKNLLHEHPSENVELSMELSGYASTLHQFYNAIEDIQKVNFKEKVNQSINYINNFVMGEIKTIICEKISQKSTSYCLSLTDYQSENSKIEQICRNDKEYYHMLVQNQERRKENIERYSVYA